MLTQEQRHGLEDLIDATSLDGVLSAIADVAREKADHLRSVWQDNGMAVAWDRAAGRIEKTAQTIYDRERL